LSATLVRDKAAEMLKIALPNKGRLAEDIRALFGEAGLPVNAVNERSLSASLGGEFEAIFVRAQDIPEFVADNAAEAGITGWDLVSESGRSLEMLLDLEFGRCRLVLAAREESGVRALDQIQGVPRVATCFPKLTKRFFNDAKRQVEIVPVSGAAEIAPRLGIAELVVDLTSTGSTLRVNGLVEIATLLESSARLISRSGTQLRRELRELVDALASVLRARGRRYLMANVPRQSLDEVRKVLPGLNGPTVVDVLDGGRFVAVHAVVDSSSIYRTIAALKSLGAEGILVTKIERLMP